MIILTVDNIFILLFAGMGLGIMMGAAFRQIAIDSGWVRP